LDTRAAIRGLCVERFYDQIHRIQWERIVFQNGLLKKEIDLGSLFDPAEIASLRARIDHAANIKDIF
jgi:hypothetical protein